MRKILFALVLVLISVASYAATGDEHHSFSQPSTRTVSGTEIGHFKNGPVPIDLSATTIAAYVPNGSGGYNTLAGSGTSSGTFTIANVPSGSYLLQLGNMYLWTQRTVVDADFNEASRSDVVQADQNTTVTFDLTNLNAWQDTDIFEMVCPNNFAFDGFPGTVGQKTLTGTFRYFGSLSVGTEGDQYYLIQLITQSVGGFTFDALGRYMAPPKFTQAQGSDTPINGRLRTIAQNQTFEANVNGADLAALAAAGNPKAVLIDTSIFLDAFPGSLSKGENVLTSTPDLVSSNAGTGLTSNVDLGKVSYGNPFPPSKWNLYVGYSYTASTAYTAPGATNGTNINSVAFDETPTLPTSKNPIKPLVGVVAKPSINGKKFFKDQTGVGFTPLLKWSPPSLGTPTYYVVQIFQLTNDGGNTVRTSIANLYTQGTSLRVPPGLLATGPGYVFRIRPWYVPGLNFAKTPFMYGPTTAVADVLSGMMQP